MGPSDAAASYTSGSTSCRSYEMPSVRRRRRKRSKPTLYGVFGFGISGCRTILTDPKRSAPIGHLQDVGHAGPLLEVVLKRVCQHGPMGAARDKVKGGEQGFRTPQASVPLDVRLAIAWRTCISVQIRSGWWRWPRRLPVRAPDPDPLADLPGSTRDAHSIPGVSKKATLALVGRMMPSHLHSCLLVVRRRELAARRDGLPSFATAAPSNRPRGRLRPPAFSNLVRPPFRGIHGESVATRAASFHMLKVSAKRKSNPHRTLLTWADRPRRRPFFPSLLRCLVHCASISCKSP
eukprot:scaffold3031_cov285-Pinguiococcus_pyrenoidosus.AAC.6